MKVTVSDTPKAFQPVSFTITCETQEELDGWDFLARHCHLNGAIFQNESKLSKLHDYLSSKGANPDFRAMQELVKKTLKF
jgi:hypothetical protein